MKKATVVEIISYLFILLFLYAGTSKILTYATFRLDLLKSPLTHSLAPVIAILLPVIEIAVSIFLFLPGLRRWGLYCSLILMALFTFYVIYLFVFSPSLPCHCAGIFREMTWTGHLIFNIIFTFLALIGIWLDRDHFREAIENSSAMNFI